MKGLRCFLLLQVSLLCRAGVSLHLRSAQQGGDGSQDRRLAQTITDKILELEDSWATDLFDHGSLLEAGSVLERGKVDAEGDGGEEEGGGEIVIDENAEADVEPPLAEDEAEEMAAIVKHRSDVQELINEAGFTGADLHDLASEHAEKLNVTSDDLFNEMKDIMAQDVLVKMSAVDEETGEEPSDEEVAENIDEAAIALNVAPDELKANLAEKEAGEIYRKVMEGGVDVNSLIEGAAAKYGLESDAIVENLRDIAASEVVLQMKGETDAYVEEAKKYGSEAVDKAKNIFSDRNMEKAQEFASNIADRLGFDYDAIYGKVEGFAADTLSDENIDAAKAKLNEAKDFAKEKVGQVADAAKEKFEAAAELGKKYASMASEKADKFWESVKDYGEEAFSQENLDRAKANAIEGYKRSKDALLASLKTISDSDIADATVAINAVKKAALTRNSVTAKEGCVGCNFIWEKIHSQMTAASGFDDVRDAFLTICKSVPAVFQDACDRMDHQLDDMVKDYLKGDKINDMCTVGGFCWSGLLM